jgi:hypothetical protein
MGLPKRPTRAVKQLVDIYAIEVAAGCRKIAPEARRENV